MDRRPMGPGRTGARPLGSRPTGPQFEFAGAGTDPPFSAEILGTGSGGVLEVSMETSMLARAIDTAAFHLQPELVGAPSDPVGDLHGGQTEDTARIQLRPVGGMRPPDGLDAPAAARWLATSATGTSSADWLVTQWSIGADRHRTAWDYLAAEAADPADPLGGALGFIIDGHPGAADELAEAGRLLAALTPGAGSMLDEVAAVLTGLGVRSDLMHDGGPLAFAMQSDPVADVIAQSWNCLANERPDSWLVIYAELPVAVAPADLLPAAAVVAAINRELLVGALIIDETGDPVMYRAATDLGSNFGRAASIRRLLDLVQADTQACLAYWRSAWATA